MVRICVAHPFILLPIPPLSPLSHLVISMEDSGWGSVDEWPTTDTSTTAAATTSNGAPNGASETPESSPEIKLPKTRGYQQEMLDESMHKNIVIALDTGAGKTHIAVLRMKHEVEKETSKVCGSLVYRSTLSKPLCDTRIYEYAKYFTIVSCICSRFCGTVFLVLPIIVWHT